MVKRDAQIKIGATLAYDITIVVTVHGADDIVEIERSHVFIKWMGPAYD